LTAPLPLAGITVLDLTTFLSGPMATHTLGELGADVIKIEPPDGDPTRVGLLYWAALHRDRRSVVLDLKRPSGVAVLRELVGRADVLIENYRPGVTSRLGITDADLRPLNPRLVTCSITGYGPDGAAADRPATDGPIQAFSGALELNGSPVPLTVGDLSGAAHAATAIVAALFARERTGRGSHVELSLAECLLQWLTVGDRGGTLSPPTTLVVTAGDGRRLLIQTPMHMRARFVELVGLQDPRWATVEGQKEALGEYVAQVAAAIGAKPSGEWLTALAGAGIPAAAVRTIEEAMADPHLVERGATVVLDVPGAGPTRVALSPFVVDGARRRATTLPPVLGADTESVLRDILGYDDARLAEARADGAFG
jgi:CoA:oxalate CoA-transferase